MIDGVAQNVNNGVKRTCCNNENNGPYTGNLLMTAGVFSTIGVLGMIGVPSITGTLRNRYTADEQNATSPPCGILDALCLVTDALSWLSNIQCLNRNH